MIVELMSGDVESDEVGEPESQCHARACRGFGNGSCEPSVPQANDQTLGGNEWQSMLFT